jgi:hypothetical protein
MRVITTVCFLEKGDQDAVAQLGRWLKSNPDWEHIELQSLAGGRQELTGLASHLVRRSANRWKNALGVLLGQFPLSYEITDTHHPYLATQAL